MTAAQAVRAECRLCNNMTNFCGCASEICALNNRQGYKSTLRMIKGHCLSCVPDGSSFAVKDCDGQVFSKGSIAKCNLHPFRLGKSPFRVKREYSAEQRSEMRRSFIERLRPRVSLENSQPLSEQKGTNVWVRSLERLKNPKKGVL